MPAKTAVAKVAKSEIYDQLKTLLKRYSPPFTVCPPDKVGKKRTCGLWEQKDYVGFYYMPIYMNPKISKEISPQLLKMLKGKCCFHVKTVDAELLDEVKTLLDLGWDCFKKSGWV
jgi:hypothetical protein